MENAPRDLAPLQRWYGGHRAAVITITGRSLDLQHLDVEDQGGAGRNVRRRARRRRTPAAGGRTSFRRPPTFMPFDALVPAGDDLAGAQGEGEGSPRSRLLSNLFPSGSQPV